MRGNLKFEFVQIEPILGEVQKKVALNLDSLIKAITALDRSLIVSCVFAKMSLLDSDQQDTMRAGVIQNFETAYGLCWKFMKKWIEENVDTTVADGVTRRELYRISAENKLISSVDKWMIFHNARNLTSHTYDSKIAKEAFQIAVDFLPLAKEFLDRICSHND